jgi:hypothetical protein
MFAWIKLITSHKNYFSAVYARNRYLCTLGINLYIFGRNDPLVQPDVSE